MKKITAFLFGAIALLAVSCKKDSGTSEQTATAGSWKLGNTTYTIKYSFKTTTSQNETLYNFYDATPTGSNTATLNSVSLSFKTAPTASGTYQIVGYSATPTGTQCQISAGGPGAGGSYAYVTGNPVNITVTVTGGKVKFTIPEITLKSTGSGADQVFSGSVGEL